MTIKQQGGIFGRNPTFKTVSADRIEMSDATTVTIASGAVEITQAYHRVDTEAGASTDDLDTINGGLIGQLLILRSDNTARDVTVKDGTGNLNIAGDFTLTNNRDVIVLLCINTGTSNDWIEISRSDNN